MAGESSAQPGIRGRLCFSTASKREPRVCFPELHDEFPELVTKSGSGWLIRHFRHLVKMIRNDEDELFSEETHALINGLS